MNKYKVRYNEGVQGKIEEKEIEAEKFEIVVNTGNLFVLFIDIGDNPLAAFSNVLSVEKIEKGEAT